MKEYYMIVERDEAGWYVGSVPELPGCHTQARTIEELGTRMKEAIELYLEDEDRTPLPSTEFIGVHRVPVPSILLSKHDHCPRRRRLV